MRYIRTKDGIYRVLQYGSAKKHYVVISVVGLGKKVIDTSEIIKQADTIEELCDTYVYVDKNNGKPTLSQIDFVTTQLLVGNKVYLAIWTDKGLIYVAEAVIEENIVKVKLL